jgi:Cu/Ag efflux protein CusF
MQRLAVTALALLSVLPVPALAQSSHAGMAPAAAPAKVAKTAPMTDGVVQRVDRQGGTVTIAHEPLVNLGMPKMTMTFQLKERALVDGIKEGSRVKFVAENVNGALTVVALQAAK